MFETAKANDAGTGMVIKDVAELIAENLTMEAIVHN
jgi:hypothetical protein